MVIGTEPSPEAIVQADKSKQHINFAAYLIQGLLTVAMPLLIPSPLNSLHVAGWLVLELAVVIMFKAVMFLVLEQGGVFKWNS